MSGDGRRIEIRGTVQGVGFRPWVYRLAQEVGISGRVCNDGRGVTIEAFGVDEVLDAFLRRLETETPRGAKIRELSWSRISPQPFAGFTIEESQRGDMTEVSIPADLATCARCLAEIADPSDRRYRYAFTNCTDCGPRFTIAKDIPYDRPSTSMAGFTMCAACRREYETAGDRRFHAQPNACPQCGPRLRLIRHDGVTIASADPIAEAVRALAEGQIVALKGIGGFHLTCDATSESAVAELRRRKRREAKPLAVMVADLGAAHSLAVLSDAEVSLLTSVQRPIVLVSRRAGCGLAESISPDNPLVGLLLPYSPLHHIILGEVGRPLVMTSGNLTDEPIAFHDADALWRLAGVADMFLVHDREIVTRCDDSVARVIAGEPVVLRRSRGYVPQAVSLARSFSRPVLACGGQLKSTFCFGRERSAVLGPHIGDLDNLEAMRSFEDSIERMERFLRIQPQVIAHDLHPSYPSTEYAAKRLESVKIAVQHHHAHVAAAMADNGLTGPVLGIAYDGTGYGTDGTAWGGEIMVADFAGFRRLATLRPISLAGGDVAIREVWRIALAAVDDAFDGQPPLDELRLFAEVAADSVRVVRQMIAAGFNSPKASGLGRYYDAVGALVLGMSRSRFEGQVAMALDFASGPGETRSYPFDMASRSSLSIVDLRPTIRAVVNDVIATRPAGEIAARFQNAIIEATAASVKAIGARSVEITGRRGLPIVLSGGCFQNARLASGIRRRLACSAEVHLHRDVPPGDGGLSLGQAVVADAVLARGGGWREMEMADREWIKCA